MAAIIEVETMFNLDKARGTIPCPRCDYPNEILMREARFGLTVLCRGCKSSIRLLMTNGGAEKAKHALDDFQNMFPTKITIKL